MSRRRFKVDEDEDEAEHVFLVWLPWESAEKDAQICVAEAHWYAAKSDEEDHCKRGGTYKVLEVKRNVIEQKK